MLIFTFTGDTNLQDLVNELQEVTDWFQLGLCLKVPLSILRSIQQDSKEDTNKCRQEMLNAWMKRGVPMWSTIVKALLDMKKADLALKIASKHFGKLNGGGSYMYCDIGETSCELKIRLIKITLASRYIGA